MQEHRWCAKQFFCDHRPYRPTGQNRYPDRLNGRTCAIPANAPLPVSFGPRTDPGKIKKQLVKIANVALNRSAFTTQQKGQT